MSVVRKFAADTQGNVAIMSAICMVVIMGTTALGVDLGKIYTDRRHAQSTTDLAAMVAAGDIGRASKAAAAVVQDNDFTPSAPANIELGVYVADPALAPQNRFTPSAADAANAVRVTLTTQTPLIFGKIITGTDSFRIQTVATAATTAMASFAIGSRLLSVNGGLLNQLLGGLLGVNISLTAMDYQALIDTKIDLVDFMNAYAGRVAVTAGTYNSLLASNAKLTDVVAAMFDAQKTANGNNAATQALASIATAANGSTAKLPLGSLVDLGPYGDLAIGQKPKVGAKISLYDLLTATGQIANGKHQIAVGLNLNLPGIASASLKLSVGERPVGTSWVTVGSRGASVHTAQTRMLLTVRLGGSGSIAAVNLPIYVEVASGTAVLNSVTCGRPDIGSSTVALGVTPGILDAWIADVSDYDFNNFSMAPNPGPASLVNVIGIGVTGRAHAKIGDTTPTTVNFSYADIMAQTRKTVSTTSYVSPLMAKLIDDLTLNVTVGGLNLGLSPIITKTVSGLIAAQTAPLDQLLASLLSTVGVGLGQADVWVSGVRCDGAVLVN